MSLVLTHPTRHWSVTVGSGVGFIAYAATSLLWSPEPIQGAALLLGLWISFLVGYAARREVWLALWFFYSLFLLYNLALMAAQRFGFAIDLWSYDGTWGLYGNPNLLGCALAIGLASALVYANWIMIPPLVWGLWLTQSRGAILGSSVALFICMRQKSKAAAFLIVAIGALAIALSAHGEADGLWQRLGIWQSTLSHLTIFGSGFASFGDSYWAFPLKINMGFARPLHAYNDFLELTFELGLGAILLWTFLIGVLSESKSEAKLILYTYGALALTFFPLYVWPIGPLVAATLGHLVRENNGCA